jgi:hypothetical protein
MASKLTDPSWWLSLSKPHYQLSKNNIKFQAKGALTQEKSARKILLTLSHERPGLPK